MKLLNCLLHQNYVLVAFFFSTNEMKIYLPLAVLHSLKIIQLRWVSWVANTPAVGQSHIIVNCFIRNNKSEKVSTEHCCFTPLIYCLLPGNVQTIVIDRYIIVYTRGFQLNRTTFPLFLRHSIDRNHNSSGRKSIHSETFFSPRKCQFVYLDNLTNIRTLTPSLFDACCV